MTGVVRLATQSDAKQGTVNSYSWTEPKLGELGLEKDGPIAISFIGEETTQNEGRKQTLRSYSWGHDILRTNSQGMVVSMSLVSNPQSAMMTVANYKEYAPWAPKL
jgi:hypothetical protein